MALRVAILGSGNIGTDLMVKVRRTPALRLVAVVGIDPASDGLARARALGVPASDAGLERWLATDPDVDVVMEATSARAHAAHAPLLAARGIRCIDLTPAALGPPVVPDAGLDRRLDAPDVSLVTCGAQATVPVVAALSAVAPVGYAEVVCTVASRSAGPGTRQNIDEFTVATARSLETLGGAATGKAVIILNPAEPPIVMRNTVYAEVGGMDPVGVGHGDGLGASSIQYLRALHPDAELLRAARRVLRHARLAVTFQPGIGTGRHLEQAAELGADLARIATHCTEADVASQHIGLARELGMDVHGDLMMPHMTTPAKLAEQARIMVDAGARGVHIMDSAGALTPDDVKARVAAFRDAFGGDAEVGIHAHENLSLAVANTLVAVEEGATLADACLAGAGAGAGNCQMEALVAVLDRVGRPTGIDLFALQDLASDHVRPAMPRQPALDRTTLTQGYAGVPGSFLLHAQRVAERFGVDPRDLIVAVGRAQAVSGQEDLLIEIAARAAGRSEAAG